MLSRIAESTFWIGRYLERADSTARILDVHVQMLVEDPWVDEARVCSSLLEVMGVPDGTGEVQTSKKQDTYPDGASGYHTVQVSVA